MDDVLNDFELERKDLDFKCPKSIFNSIAGEIVDDWKMIGRELVSGRALKSLTSVQDPGSPEEKAVAMLDTWDEEKGSKATCLKLAEVLYSRKKINTLEIFCKIIRIKADGVKDQGMSHDLVLELSRILRLASYTLTCIGSRCEIVPRPFAKEKEKEHSICSYIRITAHVLFKSYNNLFDH